METFSALLDLCEGNPPVTGGFPSQWQVTRSFDVFFDLRLNKWLSKQSWDWWLETLSSPLWRHSNEYMFTLTSTEGPQNACVKPDQVLCNYNAHINSLWPSDVLWGHVHVSGSTLAQVMVWCLTTPSHYRNQCWLFISEDVWHLPDDNFTENDQDIVSLYSF